MNVLEKIRKAPAGRLDKLSRSGGLSLFLAILGGLELGVLSLWFASIVDRTAMFISYFTIPAIAALNLIPVVLLSILLFFATGRAWVGYAISTVIVMGLTAGNYFKLTFRNDPLMLGDLLLIREAGNMAGQYQLFLNKSMVLALVLILLTGLFLFFFARGKIGLRYRLAGIGVLLLSLLPIKSLYTDWNIYANVTRNEALISPWSATQVYTSKGFLYPFIYSAKETLEFAPDGYSAAHTKELLSAYPSQPIPDGEKIDLFAFQLEAYNDFTKFDVPGLSPEVYESYHTLEEESYTGNLLANVFAGGTVDTERSFLTGLKDLGSFRSPSNSFVQYFRDQGYFTQGNHPCYWWFYNRRNVNPNLGFDEYWYVENYYSPMTEGAPGMDKALFPEIIAQYEEFRAKSDQPYFSFNVTYQGHGPYDSNETWWGEGHVEGGDYSPGDRNLLNNYFGSIHSTNQQLVEFFDYFRNSSQPVVILLYGDHNPWMGDNNYVYDNLGINLDLNTQEGFFNYYGTRYLIWANDAAKKTLGNDFVGNGPDISPNFLMNQLFRLAGWEGPSYLQFTDRLMDELPIMNTSTGLFVEDGQLTDTLSPQRQALLKDYEHLEYYWKKQLLKE